MASVFFLAMFWTNSSIGEHRRVCPLETISDEQFPLPAAIPPSSEVKENNSRSKSLRTLPLNEKNKAACQHPEGWIHSEEGGLAR